MTDTEEDLYQLAINQPLEFKINRALSMLKLYEKKALQLHPEGYWLAFSGGKDSIVLKDLAIRSGVKFQSVYNQTTIDPPELVKYIRDIHPDVKFSLAHKEGFFGLVAKKGLPTPRSRWCCQAFKENGGKGWFKLVGVRAPESARRKKLWREYQFKLGSEYLAPLCYWTNEDVWNYIKSRNLPYCKLYDNGWERIGCIGCPLAGIKNMNRDFKAFPKFEAAYKAAAKRYCEARDKAYLDGTRKRRLKTKALPFEMYWKFWREQIYRAKDDARCAFEEMLSQIGIQSQRQLNNIEQEENL